jgi:hypothetical protein
MGRLAGGAAFAFAFLRGALGLQIEFAFPQEGGEAFQSFGDVPDEGDDHGDQRRREPGALTAAPRLRPLAELLAQVGEAVCRGGVRSFDHVVTLVWIGVGGQGGN